MSTQRSTYTPSELNREVKLHLEAGFGRIRLEGELSNLSRPASGHLYFTIKDDRAQIRCALFRSAALKLPFRPENGAQILASGRISLYEARGDFQMIVDSMEAAGEGALRAQFEALKKKLQSEGLFDEALKKPLPAYPTKISVITSPSGAVIRDITHVLKRRWPLCAIRLYPVPVQGEESPAAICAALKAVDAHQWADLTILARGGGALEDLHAFNHEQVARQVAQCITPLISAVGHETDFSISDFVADQRAPTPSAAAEIATPDGPALKQRFTLLQSQLVSRIQEQLRRCSQQHDQTALRLARQHPARRITEQASNLQKLKLRLQTGGLRLTPERLRDLKMVHARLVNGTSRLIPERRNQLQHLARTLNAVSPLPTLDRGYAIITADGVAVDSATVIQPQQRIQAQLKDGRLNCTVDEVDDHTLSTEN